VVSAGISRNFDESEFSRFHCNFLATAARENRIKQGEREREREKKREGGGPYRLAFRRSANPN